MQEQPLSNETAVGVEVPLYDLSPTEEFFLGEILMLTGRENRLARKPILTPIQQTTFCSLLPAILDSKKRGLGTEATCDLFNRLLLGLGIKPVAPPFFKEVFGDVDLADERQFHRQVEKFRIVCMLEFGGFRYGYKLMRSGKGKGGKTLSALWKEHFPTADQIRKQVEVYQSRPGPIGLVEIPPQRLVALGYISGEHTTQINTARTRLKAILDEGVSRGVKDIKGLTEVASAQGENDIANLLCKAGVADAERLLYPAFWAAGVSFRKIIDAVKECCKVLDNESIRQAQKDGEQNTLTYVAMHDVDVYVATSMREPLHFTNNNAFVHRLFKEGDLGGWHVRYFDPTQSYVPDRILKGLTECLMIKRASVTVYNAQEEDTFGKDAEAAVALAQGKPVIVYVARLFGEETDLRKVYNLLDSAARSGKEAFLRALRDGGFLDEAEWSSLMAPEKTTSDCVQYVAMKQAEVVLKRLESSKIEAELMGHGYNLPIGVDLAKFAAEHVKMLERRAQTFRETHPLSLQASPMDGVARGVIVTRSVSETAKILQGLLAGGLEYEVVERDYCWTLVEKSTRSPVRVVTKDDILTTAFWSEWDESDSPPN